MNNPNIANKSNLKLRNIYKRAFICGSKSKYVFSESLSKPIKKDSPQLKSNLLHANRVRIIKIVSILFTILLFFTAVIYLVFNL